MKMLNLFLGQSVLLYTERENNLYKDAKHLHHSKENALLEMDQVVVDAGTTFWNLRCPLWYMALD